MNRLGEKELAARDRICMALDLHDEGQILGDVRELSAYIGYFKLNFAFTLFGPELVKKIQATGAKVFLDLKIHDIPNTVAGYAKSVCELGVDMVTVHTEGGTAMLKELVRATQEYKNTNGRNRPKLIGVTLLTSIDQPMMNSDLNINGSIEDEVLRRAEIAVTSGLDGIVCSAAELTRLKKRLPESTFYVTPGIRPFNSSSNDHKRVASCSEALAAGSNLLVVGRDLLTADDRIGYAKSILDQVANLA